MVSPPTLDGIPPGTHIYCLEYYKFAQTSRAKTNYMGINLLICRVHRRIEGIKRFIRQFWKLIIFILVLKQKQTTKNNLNLNWLF